VSQNQQSIEQVALVRLLRLNAVVHGISTGAIAGLGLFLATNWLILKGGGVVGPHLALLGQFFIGYEVTFVGSLVGFAYGFGSGFVAGYFVCSMYNWLAVYRERATRATER
jgi:hypothetical protein